MQGTNPEVNDLPGRTVANPGGFWTWVSFLKG